MVVVFSRELSAVRGPDCSVLCAMEHIVNIAILLLYFAAGAAVVQSSGGMVANGLVLFPDGHHLHRGIRRHRAHKSDEQVLHGHLALVGMSSIFSMLEPVVEMLSNGIDVVEKAVTGFLENQGCIAPAVDTLDMSIPLKEISTATINYPVRYFLALTNPLVIMLLGLAIATVVVEEGGWVDCLYFSIISMTTISYVRHHTQIATAKVLCDALSTAFCRRACPGARRRQCYRTEAIDP